jgi:hypothetical protein
LFVGEGTLCAIWVVPELILLVLVVFLKCSLFDAIEMLFGY